MKRTAKLRRSSPLRRVSRQRVSLRSLRDLCRKLVVELRDGNACQCCGRRLGRIEWAHVVTRNAPSIVYAPWNSLALCGPRSYSWSCHFWFDTHKGESLEWWREKFPDRALKLDAWRHDRRRPKIDRYLEKLALEQQIAQVESGIRTRAEGEPGA